MLFLTTLAIIPALTGSPTSSPSVDEYVRSDGFMHERLTLATSGTFKYRETGCVGGPTTYEGHAQLKAERVSIQGRHGVLERDLTAVTWGTAALLGTANADEALLRLCVGRVDGGTDPVLSQVGGSVEAHTWRPTESVQVD